MTTKTNKKYIEAFDRKFTYKECNCGFGISSKGVQHKEEDCPEPFTKYNLKAKEIKAFLIKTIDAVRAEEQRYKGKLKKEWYMQGFREGREETSERVLKYAKENVEYLEAKNYAKISATLEIVRYAMLIDFLNYLKSPITDREEGK